MYTVIILHVGSRGKFLAERGVNDPHYNRPSDVDSREKSLTVSTSFGEVDSSVKKHLTGYRFLTSHTSMFQQENG